MSANHCTKTNDSDTQKVKTKMFNSADKQKVDSRPKGQPKN